MANPVSHFLIQAPPALARRDDNTPDEQRLKDSPPGTALGWQPTGDYRELRTAMLNRASDILALESEWRSLETEAPDTVLFQSFDWCRNHLDFMAGQSDFRPRVLTVRRKGRLVALLPLCEQQKSRLRVLTGFSEPFQQYTELLVSAAVDPRSLRRPLQAALSAAGADFLHFGQVREDGALALALKDIVSETAERDAAPYVVLSDYPDFAAYQKTVRSKTRKNLRNARNRLERDAPVRHARAFHGELFNQVVERVFDGREAWLERLGLTSRAFRDERFAAFLARFTELGRTAGIKTIAMSLTHGDTPLSDQWGFVYRGRYYAFMATWNPAYEAASPGRMHLGEVIRTGFEEGFKVADFMIPASRYKMNWTDRAVPVRDYVLGFSLPGKLYTRVWLGYLRPRSKRWLFAMPQALRTFISRRLLPLID